MMELILKLSIMIVFGICLYRYMFNKADGAISEPVKTILKKLKDSPECFIFDARDGIVGDRYVFIKDKETTFSFMITYEDKIFESPTWKTNLSWVTTKEEKVLISSFIREVNKRESGEIQSRHLQERAEVAKLYNVEIKK